MKETKEGNDVKCRDLIDISHIPELNEFKFTNEGVTLGGALSLTKIITILAEMINEQNGEMPLFTKSDSGLEQTTDETPRVSILTCVVVRFCSSACRE